MAHCAVSCAFLIDRAAKAAEAAAPRLAPRPRAAPAAVRLPLTSTGLQGYAAVVASNIPAPPPAAAPAKCDQTPSHPPPCDTAVADAVVPEPEPVPVVAPAVKPWGRYGTFKAMLAGGGDAAAATATTTTTSSTSASSASSDTVSSNTASAVGTGGQVDGDGKENVSGAVVDQHADDDSDGHSDCDSTTVHGSVHVSASSFTPDQRDSPLIDAPVADDSARQEAGSSAHVDVPVGDHSDIAAQTVTAADVPVAADDSTAAGDDDSSDEHAAEAQPVADATDAADAADVADAVVASSAPVLPPPVARPAHVQAHGRVSLGRWAAPGPAAASSDGGDNGVTFGYNAPSPTVAVAATNADTVSHDDVDASAALPPRVNGRFKRCACFAAYSMR